MKHFTPTLDIKETSQNIQSFVKDNMDLFWAVFKPYMPYIIILYLIDFIASDVFMPINAKTGEPHDFGLGGLIANYFFACFIISWHRVVIHGPDAFTPVNPLKPQKSDWAFIGMMALITIIPVMGGFTIGLLGGLVHVYLLLLFIPFIIAIMFVALKIMFYFPSKATGGTTTLKQSFALTKGYIWKIIASNFFASLKTLLFMVLYLLIGALILFAIGFGAAALKIETQYLASIMGTLYAMPFILFFQPLLMVIGVTALSNYYQHAIQNKEI